MKRLILITATFILSAWQCSDDAIKPNQCAIPATIRDLTGLDGCGWVFELEDGSRLEPVDIFRCGTPPVPEDQPEDVLANFELVDGKRVMISYTEIDAVSACMVGKMVTITCISELPQTVEH